MKTQSTIEYRGVVLDVEYIYHEPEGRTHDYPGTNGEVELISVEHLGVDVEWLLQDQLDNIIEEIISRL